MQPGAMSTTILGTNTRRNIDTHYFISLQMKELEEAWGALPGEPAVPTRLLRSQQQSQAAAVSVGGGPCCRTALGWSETRDADDCQSSDMATHACTTRSGCLRAALSGVLYLSPCLSPLLY